MTITTLNHTKNNTFFFSTDHCQMVIKIEDKYFSNNEWVPVTSELPMYVKPRPGLEDGWINTLEDYIKIFHSGEIEIPNPDPRYTPDYRK